MPRPPTPTSPAASGLDFGALDAWSDEDERNVAHPRDPFHRIDIVHSSRQVRSRPAARSWRSRSDPYLLFEPPLPVRYYLPREDVHTDLLATERQDGRSAPTRAGRRTGRSRTGRRCVWSYAEPLRDAAEITGRMAFFNERVDIVVDGVRSERPLTPWSRGGR